MTVVEAVKDKLRDLRDSEKVKLPPEVEERIKRGRERMRDGAAKRDECLHMWRSDQQVAVSSENYLVKYSTVTNTDGTGKPPHRMRTTRNHIIDKVQGKTSAATRRIPSYETSPTKTDPDTLAAARLAGDVALFGYDEWRLRNAAIETVTYALVADEGFAWPYFDNTIGPYVKDTDEEGNERVVGVGDVRVRIFGPNEVYWEPGVKFYESRWHCVERALPLEEVYEMEGYLGGKLTPDANTDDAQPDAKRKQQVKMVLVTDYLERPCPKYPKGRWFARANGRAIVREREFPHVDGEGNPVNEPVLHMLSYIVDPDSDRDMGLVRHLLDAQRTINDCENRALEWKNLALRPQIFVAPGVLGKQRITDEPGAVYEIPEPDKNVKWREVPAIPTELFTLRDSAAADIARISAQNDIPSQVEAGKAVQVLIERDEDVWQAFIGNLAEWHSRLMRHCLCLVQRHYTEPRLLKFQGTFGPQLIEGFEGAQLRSQVDVRVSPASIEPRTKAAIEARVLAFADRAWISPEAAMSAINAGTAEKLIESYERDIQRAHIVIQQIKTDPQGLMARPPRIDNGEEVPAWMPRRFDKLPVHRAVFEDWMKTVEYDSSPPEVQEMANLYYDGLLWLEAKEAAEQAAMQAQTAEAHGMANAARPRSKPMPSQPALDADKPPAPQPRHN